MERDRGGVVVHLFNMRHGSPDSDTIAKDLRRIGTVIGQLETKTCSRAPLRLLLAMSTHRQRSVRTSAGIPAIIFACALAVPSTFIFAFLVGMMAGSDGTWSELTLPRGFIVGACLGAGVGGFLALLFGCHLRRGFSYVFGAALGAIACMILSNSYFSVRSDPHQLLKDAIALGVIFLGLLGAAAVEQKFVKRFGARSRSWAWIGAGTAAGGVWPLAAARWYAFSDWQGPPRHEFGEIFLNALVGGFGFALIAAIVLGWIAALAGAIREPG
jgi:hypothetical protein